MPKFARKKIVRRREEGLRANTLMLKLDTDNKKNLRVVFTPISEMYLFWNKCMRIYREIWSNLEWLKIMIVVDNIYLN